MKGPKNEKQKTKIKNTKTIKEKSPQKQKLDKRKIPEEINNIEVPPEEAIPDDATLPENEKENKNTDEPKAKKIKMTPNENNQEDNDSHPNNQMSHRVTKKAKRKLWENEYNYEFDENQKSQELTI